MVITLRGCCGAIWDSYGRRVLLGLCVAAMLAGGGFVVAVAAGWVR